MVTPRKIGRLSAAHQFELLLEAVLANGRPLPIQARLRITEPESLAGAALGLGLQRLIELSGFASAECADLAADLLSHQRDDGSFGTPSATAVAAKGLQMFISAPGAPPPLSEIARAALDSAVHAIHCAIERDRIRGGAGLPGDDLEAALVLWQVGDLEPIRTLLDLDRVRRALHHHLEPHSAAELVLRAAGAPVPERAAAA